jgi:hypothetical protein
MSIMRVILPVLLLLFILNSELFAQKYIGNDSFTSPLKPPFSFSGIFGELRPSHFHSGIDFRTQGKTGLPVYAVKQGFISRIGVSPSGYGNALYMDHPDGTTSVYAHLEKFHPLLMEYVKEKQYDRESFQVTISLLPGIFHFNKGDIIAWSGNSGSSGGPHLHFEIRNTDSERVCNPVFYNFGIKDNSPPKIKAIYVYPLGANSNIGQDHIRKRFETIPVSGGYRLKSNLPIELFGNIAFGIQADDDFSGTGFKCGIYSASVSCDGKPYFGFKMDNFSFVDSRYANAQADYEEYIKSHKWVQKLYRQPGNHLDIYDPGENDGIFNFDDGKGHEFEIVVSDAFNNRTTLKFRTKSKKFPSPSKYQSFNKLFLFNEENFFENDRIRIDVPKDALYENLEFVWNSGPKPAGCFSDLHKVHSKFVPLHKPYSLSIKCEGLPDDLRNNALIVSVDPSTGEKSPVGGEYSGGWITVKTNLFGTFAVAVDKTPPAIIPLSIKDKTILTDKSKVQFKIYDDLSGIKSYRGEIDGEWVLFEYDAKNRLLSYSFDKNRMVFGRSHLLRLVVTDYRDNRAEYKAVIYK